MSRYTRIKPQRHENGDVTIRMDSVTANRLANLMREMEGGIIPLLTNLGDMSQREMYAVYEDFGDLARACQNLSDIPKSTGENE